MSRPKHTSIRNEKELIRKLKKGNIEAFEILYNAYSLRLYHFGLKYLKSECDAEGFVQDVFAKIWEKRSSLNEDLSFRSYMFTILFNLIRKSFIRKTKLRDYLQNEQARIDIDLATVKRVEHKSSLDYLYNLIEQLPERRREIFIKSRVEDLPAKEIARQMGISVKTVENQITAATKFIKAKWIGEPWILLFLTTF